MPWWHEKALAHVWLGPIREQRKVSLTGHGLCKRQLRSNGCGTRKQLKIQPTLNLMKNGLAWIGWGPIWSSSNKVQLSLIKKGARQCSEFYGKERSWRRELVASTSYVMALSMWRSSNSVAGRKGDIHFMELACRRVQSVGREKQTGSLKQCESPRPVQKAMASY